MSAHWEGGNGGKGSKSRPLSISQEEYANRWGAIFGKKKKAEDNTGTSSNEYQDVLSTEDCMEYDAPATRYNQETQEVLKYNK